MGIGIDQNKSKCHINTMRKPRAIVCDDDHQILDLFRSVIEMMGYEVLTAETPITCAFYRDHVDSCRQHHRCADVLITDYSMPSMTGLDLLVMQHQRGCKLTSQNKALMTGNEDSELLIAVKVMSYLRRKERPLFLKNERSRSCFFCKERILPRVFVVSASSSIAVLLAMGFIFVCAQTYSTGLSSGA